MKKVLFGLLTIFIAGCGSGRITTTTGTKPTETIVFGKLNIESDNQLENKKILLHFNERLWGKFAVWPDEEGYFYMKLPLGNNHIALLEYRDGIGFYKNIPENYVSIDLTESNSVYYIGDISFDWTPKEEDRRRQNGATGAVIEASQEGNKVPVVVSNNQKTINYFVQKFPENKKEILTELIKIEK